MRGSIRDSQGPGSAARMDGGSRDGSQAVARAQAQGGALPLPPTHLRVELWAGPTLVADSQDASLWAKIMYVIGYPVGPHGPRKPAPEAGPDSP